MAKRGDADDAPVQKQAPLPAGEGKVNTQHPKPAAGHHGPEDLMPLPVKYGNEGCNSLASKCTADPKATAGSYTGGDPKIPAGEDPKIPAGEDPMIASSKYAGVGPMLAAGVYHRLSAGNLAGVDHKLAAGYYSSLYHMVAADDPKLTVVMPPMTLHKPRFEEVPVTLESPHDRYIIIAWRNFMKRAREAHVEKREARLDKREGRADRREERAERRDIRSEEKESINHAVALGLHKERKELEEERKQHAAFVEEERRKLEEEKKKHAAFVEELKKESLVDQKGNSQAALIASKIEHADSRLTLFEKIVNIPKRKVELEKSISENVEIVKQSLKNNKERIQRVKLFGKFLATGALGMMREQMKEAIGLGAGDAAEDLNDGGANGAGNGPNGAGSALKVASPANGTGNGPNIGGSAPKVASAVSGAGNGASGGGLVPPKVPASNAAGNGAVSAIGGGAATVSASTGAISANDGATTGSKGE